MTIRRVEERWPVEAEDGESSSETVLRRSGGGHVMRWIRSEDASVHDLVTPSHRRERAPREERALACCVFDDWIVGTAAVITDVAHNGLLAAWERYAIQVVADQVSGTLPTVTVQVQCSSDGRNWLNKASIPEINAQPLVVGAVSDVAGFDEGARPGFDRGRLRISLGGTSPSAHLRIWVAPRSMV
jgi:hypothetical protein